MMQCRLAGALGALRTLRALAAVDRPRFVHVIAELRSQPRNQSITPIRTMSIIARFNLPRPTATIAALTAALVCAAAASAPAHAADAAAPISATNAWVRWLPNNLPAAGYVTLTNASDKNIELTDVTSPDYGSAMLHQTITNGSTTKMVMVDKATVPAKGSLKIAPGGYHIMLEQAAHKIAPGDTVHLKLTFSDGETLVTPFTVKSPATAK